MTAHEAKRARYLDAWEANLGHIEDAKQGLGLSELFGGPQSSKNSAQASATEQSFFTLRLEHHKGGAVSQDGEERILLFRSDRPGAIAKIVYSSTPSPCDSTSPAGNSDGEECELRKMAQAKIHVLDVKEQYRGYDFGGLLFTEAISILQDQYKNNLWEDEGKEGEETDAAGYRTRHLRSSVRCQLEAEEDIRRHNKLVGFYERLGCSVKPKAKVRYLNNNDGETYRKVPMQIALRSEDVGPTGSNGQHNETSLFLSLLSRKRDFLPIVLCDSKGGVVGINHEGNRSDWLVVEDGSGNVEFVTTQGCYLQAEPDGHCTTLKSEPSHSSFIVGMDESWSKFRALQLCDFRPGPQNPRGEDVPEEARRKQLWVLKSTHGTFLSLDTQSQVLRCTKKPAFWQATGGSYKLTFTDDTPARRLHYRAQWIKQTVEYVRSMEARYMSFNRKEMSLREVLDTVHVLPGDFFGVNRTYPGISLRTLAFRTAEYMRNAGHPDWVQLIALVYGLAGVLKCVDMETAADCIDNFDWTLPTRSRVVGCASPSSVVFGEFHSLNDDECDPRYQSEEGVYQHHCGLENVMMTWTGSEYMYHMLRHNGVLLPQEGFKTLRLASLSDWHARDSYSHLADESDLDAQAFIADFDECFVDAKSEARMVGELSVRDCDQLWESYYSAIVGKYNADGKLAW